ncbi:MAG: HAMP domain-containing sensor histidine kinase [Thermoanaerobaculia bacterium]
MRPNQSTRTLLVGLLAIALALAGSTIALGVVASKALRSRDSAVREGALLRFSQNLEQELRASDPESAGDVLAAFARQHAAEVASVELRARGRVVASAGSGGVDATSVSVALGPAWRSLASGQGMSGQPGGPPFELILRANPQFGSERNIANAVFVGSIVAGAGLFVFAAIAAVALAQRERVVLAAEERKRLETTALAGAGLAHRIRNPLATIKGTAQMLEEQSADSSRERATRIVDAAVRIEALVDDLLRFARPVEAHPERVDLKAVAESLAARTSRVSVATHDAVVAWADREHVESAVEELVSNARTFDPGTVEIAVLTRGDRAVVEVRDRGPGLQIDASRAMEPYVTTRADGTGLGLPTIATLMRANDGDVLLEAREGGGTVASLVLPLAGANS